MTDATVTSRRARHYPPVEAGQASFDTWLARRERDLAEQAVDEHADEAWRAEAWRAIGECARVQREFTTDAVLRIVEQSPYRTRDTRALGPLMRKAQNAGLIEPAGVFAKSNDVSRHGTDKRLWRSKVFMGADTAEAMRVAEATESL